MPMRGGRLGQHPGELAAADDGDDGRAAPRGAGRSGTHPEKRRGRVRATGQAVRTAGSSTTRRPDVAGASVSKRRP